ncbi:MAG: type II toxin-antitoxin system VapC family toxin [Thermoproteales archaeon]|nr:type II toxin-antitoxin system VapC family toxin [Thermoproteales archaeon]
MAKALARVPKGTSIFVDANIFHLYLRGPKPIRDICTEFLERIEKGELKGYTSTLVLDELAYKLMLRRVEELYRRNPLKVLKENRKVVAEVAPYVEKGISIILGMEELQILSVEPFHLEDFTEYMKNYSLWPRDSLHVAVMTSINCMNIASADEDFDAIPGIVRWTPV